MNIRLSEIIRFHRKQSGLTQIELALLADLGKNMIHEIENGRQSIGFDNLLKILKILNINIEFKSPLMDSFLKGYNDESR
ncbi:MAG: helix-turn-helix domain-containing protein [Desulfobacula sp.]|jgi:HTH-type transcriptional regulator/antitoxin HipB|nr:helix-turn-helix domain-containing protein [Desulfobacula sp.]